MHRAVNLRYALGLGGCALCGRSGRSTAPAANVLAVEMPFNAYVKLQNYHNICTYLYISALVGPKLDNFAVVLVYDTYFLKIPIKKV